MPTVDMPLEQLLTYQGRNPKPDNFDAFWDKSLEEMRATDSAVELVPFPLQSRFADCFDLYFTGVGGARVHAKFLRPKKIEGPVPAILQFHGYSANSGDWHDKLNYVSQGYCVAALDCRGQGGLSEDVGGVLGNTHNGQIIRGLQNALAGAPEKLLFRQIFLDTAQLAKIVMEMPEVDETRVGATGGSQGGGLTLACAALEPRIKKAAPVFPFLCDYKRVWEMDLDVAAYSELRTWFRFYDPQHKREDEVWNALGYIDNQHLANRTRAEILMPVGLIDTICPPSTQFAAYNKITSTKNTLIYPDFGHEGLPESPDLIFNFFADL
ncbi:MAG TPA: acetylxylan esterase [Abditibacteriaceae bacterium]|jgi:cephalosporin-C deacetylase